jgi:drug/metabolite transporter (DMT)-like permease
MLLLASFIWGFAFVAQRMGMDYLSPISFNGTRYFLGAAVLAPLVLIRRHLARKKEALTGQQEELGIESEKALSPEDSNVTQTASPTSSRKDLLIAGLSCGLVLAVATNLQQIGIYHTTVGKAGFLTTLYIIIVPMLGVFMKRRVDGIIWAGALLAAVGVYLLCIDETFTINSGDIYVIVCAFVFSLHILLIAHFAPRVDGIELSLSQFLVAGIISCLIGFPLEKPLISDFIGAFWPLAYTGFLSSGVAYTLQIYGQRRADPSACALIFSLEAVFAVLGGFLILQQVLSARELIGCAIMLAAVVLVQLPLRKRI